MLGLPEIGDVRLEVTGHPNVYHLVRDLKYYQKTDVPRGEEPRLDKIPSFTSRSPAG